MESIKRQFVAWKKVKNMKYGEKIKLLRKSLGMTQSQLAEEMGVKTRAVIYWESSEKMPRAETMAELAKLFDSNVHVLFFDDESDRLR